jgi:Alkylmercury lyase
MRVEILHVPDCPNVALLEQRLRQAHPDDPGGLEVTRHVVPDLEAAVVVGMTGSPTLLVNGVDPFARRDPEPSMSCRLYADENGHVAGAPSVDALRRVLDNTSPWNELGDQCEARCEPATTGGTALRTARQRTKPADPLEQAVHRTILQAFAATGRPPEATELPHAGARVLGRLHDADVIRLDSAGRIRVAYPFSAVPTRHQVRLASGVDVHAMCAVDALGIPAMLGVDAVITTTDPVTATLITVTFADGRSTWDPQTAVVFVGSQSGTGPSADTCCDYLNMFATRESATAWTGAHHIAGEILNQVDAELLGRQIFGELLT